MIKIRPTSNNGSLRIRFKLAGKIYNIAGLGKATNRIAAARAELMAATIERDIELDNFDTSLSRYLPQTSHTEATDKPAKPNARKLLELWDLWVETLYLSEQTKSDHYRTTRSMILRAKPSPSSDSADWFLKAGAGLSAFSFNTRKRFIGNCLEWAIGQTLAETNPFRTIKSKKAAKRNKTRPLTLEQIRQILEGFKVHYPEYVPYATFLFMVGCRLSEAAGIQWKRIDFEHREITIADTIAKVNYQKQRVRQQTKTGAVTTLGMSAGLLRLLQSLPKGGPDDLVFTYADGKSISPRKYYNAWVRVLKRLGIPHVKAYVSRHSFTSHALDSGLDSSKVATFLGHAGSTMVDRNYGSAIKTPQLPDLDI